MQLVFPLETVHDVLSVNKREVVMTRQILGMVFAILSSFGLVIPAYAQQGTHIAVAVSQDGSWGAAMANGMETARLEAISACESLTDERCFRSTSEEAHWYYAVLRCREGYITAGSQWSFRQAFDNGARKFGYGSFGESGCYEVAWVSADNFRSILKKVVATNDYGWAPGVGSTYKDAQQKARDLCQELTGESCWRTSVGTIDDRFVVLRCNGQYTSALVTSSYDSAKEEAASHLGLATAEFCTEVRRY